MEMAAVPRIIQRSICTACLIQIRELLLTTAKGVGKHRSTFYWDRVLGRAFDLDQVVEAGTARALRPRCHARGASVIWVFCGAYESGYARSHLLRTFAARKFEVAVAGRRCVLLNVRYAPLATDFLIAAK